MAYSMIYSIMPDLNRYRENIYGKLKAFYNHATAMAQSQVLLKRSLEVQFLDDFNSQL